MGTLNILDWQTRKLIATININNNELKTSNQITILGLTFNSNLTWDPQYKNAIKEAAAVYILATAST